MYAFQGRFAQLPYIAFLFSAQVRRPRPEEPKKRAGRARTTSLTCSSGAGHNEARRLAEPLRHAGVGPAEASRGKGKLAGRHLRFAAGKEKPRRAFRPPARPTFALRKRPRVGHPLRGRPGEEGRITFLRLLSPAAWLWRPFSNLTPALQPCTFLVSF